jgi:Glycosyltransferase family 92
MIPQMAHNSVKYISICSIFKNESRYIKEWLDFHLSQGVDHFYLYDNNSSDEPHRVLREFIAAGKVTLNQWQFLFDDSAQIRAFQHCLKNYGAGSRWIAFIDIDEFLFSPVINLQEAMRDFEAYPGIVVHWQCYGSSGHQEICDGGVVRNYLYRAPSSWVRNRRVKSIVNPAKTVDPNGVHYFSFSEGECAVNEKGDKVYPYVLSRPSRLLNRFIARLWPQAPLDPYAMRQHRPKEISASKLRINHYVTRSAAEFREKRKRFADDRCDNFYFGYHDRNDVYDDVAWRIYKKTMQKYNQSNS